MASRLLGRPLERRDAPRAADAIVVLGAPVLDGGRLRPVARERVEVGVQLWRRGLAPIVCMTGGGPPGRVEAEAMAAYARELGLPNESLRLENRSQSTAQNARLCADLLRGEGISVVWLVTQPFHLRRAAWLFARAGFVPLAWRIEAGLQDRHPRAALRWVLREYAAWLWSAARTLARLHHPTETQAS